MVNKAKLRIPYIFAIIIVGAVVLGLFVLYKNYTLKNSLTFDKVLYAQIPDFNMYADGMVTLNNGRLEGGEYWGLGVDKQPVIFDDFNNDGKQDIAVDITASGGGSGVITYLTLFINDNGNPKYMTSIDLGDRIDVKDMTYKNGIFSVTMITQGPGEGLCCGTLLKVSKYKISDGSLIEVENS
jgi:hypothetical protein